MSKWAAANLPRRGWQATIHGGHRGQSPRWFRWFGDSPLVGLLKMRTQNLGFRHFVGEVASEVHFPLFHPIISWDVLIGFGYRDDEWFRRLHFVRYCGCSQG